jgi:ribosomal subunit interface protein
MQFPLQITLRGMPHSVALETEIRERAAKLEQIHPEIVSCRVVVEVAARHQQQGREFRVNVDARVPGREIAASHSHHEDVFAAVRLAFEAASRQLEDHARRHGAPPKDVA